MKEHIEDILVGGRPMTKLEKTNKEIERLKKGINEIIQYINSLELGSDHEETYNKEGYVVDVYDIEKMLVELIGSDKE